MALGNIHELVPSVFSVDSRFVDGKNGIVIGKRAALAIDGSNYQDEGAAMVSFIRQNDFEPHRLALTHGHGDHILGAGPLAQGEVFAHALTPAEIEKQVPGWAARWEVDEAEARARGRGELQINLTHGSTIQLYYCRLRAKNRARRF